MKHIMWTTVLLFSFCAFLHAGYKTTGFLYKDGIPQGTVNPPEQTGPAMRFAVDELVLHLEKITGAKILISYRAPQGYDPGIHLKVRNEKEWKGRESAQNFTISENGVKITITGNTEIAVLYGVYQYLDELGVRWYAPGDIGTDIPELKDIPIKKETVPRKYSPSYLAREIDYSASWRTYWFDFAPQQEVIGKYHQEHDLLALRNRQHFARPGHEGHFFNFNFSHMGGSHGITTVLKNVDITKEPERFAWVPIDGKFQRSNDFNRVQICFTNEKNVDAALEYAKDYFAKPLSIIDSSMDLEEISHAVLPLGLGDCGGFCECPECEKIAGEGPFRHDRLVWHFMNKVAKRMQTELPGKLIGIFAPYSMNMRQPPPDVKLEKNIFAQACRTEASITDSENLPTYPFNKKFHSDLTATRKAGATQGNYDYFLYKTTPTPLTLLDAAKAYHESFGFRNYHIEIMQLNAQTYAFCWALARYMWNDKTDPRKNLEEYCMNYYGISGPEILQIMNFYDTKTRKLQRIELGSMENTHMMLPDNLIKRGRTLLKKALMDTTGLKNPKYKKRVEYFIHTFESQAQAAEIYRAACRMLNSRSPETIETFKNAILKYEDYWANPEVKDAVHPDTLKFVQHFSNFFLRRLENGQIRPAAAPGFENEEFYRKELFAGTDVPKEIPNLFKLPEIWKFRIDFDNAAFKEKWFAPEFDDSNLFQDMSIYNVIEGQGYDLIDGQFCYRIKFKAPKFPDGKKIFLRFGGIDDAGKIYVNGTLAGETSVENWDKSNAFDVTNLIRQGEENQISVIGHDSYGGAGIWRPAALYTD